VHRRSFIKTVGLTATLTGPAAVFAQDAWPTRPIRFVVAFAPAGPADIVARLLAEPFGRVLKTNVVVENRGGAGGSLGSGVVAHAEPDGYTMLVNTSAYAVYPAIHREQNFDAEKALVLAALVGSSPNLIVASPKLPAKNLKDVIALAKTQRLNFSTAGIGTTPQLSGEYLFKVLAKVDVTHVPFLGAGPALNAVMADHVQLACVALAPAIELVKSGAVRPLAVTSGHRAKSLPDVPTVAESGFTGFEDVTWVGVFLPARTPANIVERVNREITAIQRSPDFETKLATNGFDVMGGSIPELQTFLHNDIARWAKVVKETGTQID
jgi:tripartite-type tricarboxylate transporter receptor subunit TctC